MKNMAEECFQIEGLKLTRGSLFSDAICTLKSLFVILSRIVFMNIMLWTDALQSGEEFMSALSPTTGVSFTMSPSG